MKKNIVLAFLILSAYGYSLRLQQDADINKAILNIRNGNLNSVEHTHVNDTLNRLFTYHILYKSKGIINDSLLIKENLGSFKNNIGVIANYTYGDYLLSNENPNDSLAFYHYINALRQAKIIKNDLLVNESYFRICNTLFANGKNLKLFKSYIDQYEIAAANRFDKFWANYFLIAYKILDHKKKNSTRNTLSQESLDFKKGFDLAGDTSYLVGYMHQMKGIYYDVMTTNYKSAELEFNSAIKQFQSIPFHFAQKKIYGNKVNFAISRFNQGKLNESAKFFEEALSLRTYIYKNKEKMFIYNWLDSIYELKGDISKAYKYSTLSRNIENEIKKTAHSIAIAKEENNSRIIEQEEKLSNLDQEVTKLSKRLMTLTPFILFFAFSAVLFFFFYKKYRKKSDQLEEDQSETLQKLDELKRIVIKNHIILKDKTKIYIADLLYIKSDDHYLNVFLSDGKNHFVRGKLSQIKEELPPNFIQCHRSYIVNSNFVKQVNSTSLTLLDKTQIPLSRSYKDRF